MKKEEKVNLILEQKRVFRISDKPKFEYWSVKGLSDVVHYIIYRKDLDIFQCDCENIRKSECYHIECVRRMMANDDDGIEYYENE